MAYVVDDIALGAIGSLLAERLSPIIKELEDRRPSRIRYETVMQGSAENILEGIRNLQATGPYDGLSMRAAGLNILGIEDPVSKILPRLEAFGSIAMGSAEKLGQLSSTFAQVNAAGILTERSLGEMVNAGFNPFKEMARLSGRSIEALQQQLLDGKITAGMVDRVVQAANNPGGSHYDSKEVEAARRRIEASAQHEKNMKTSRLYRMAHEFDSANKGYDIFKGDPYMRDHFIVEKDDRYKAMEQSLEKLRTLSEDALKQGLDTFNNYYLLFKNVELTSKNIEDKEVRDNAKTLAAENIVTYAAENVRLKVLLKHADEAFKKVSDHVKMEYNSHPARSYPTNSNPLPYNIEGGLVPIKKQETIEEYLQKSPYMADLKKILFHRYKHPYEEVTGEQEFISRFGLKPDYFKTLAEGKKTDWSMLSETYDSYFTYKKDFNVNSQPQQRGNVNSQSSRQGMGMVSVIGESGRRSNNINVTLSNLVGTINLRTENLSEGVGEIRDIVSEELLRVLNSANKMALES